MMIFGVWWRLLSDAIEKHGKYHRDGFRAHLVQLATEASADDRRQTDVDPKALTRLLNAPTMPQTKEVVIFLYLPNFVSVELLVASYEFIPVYKWREPVGQRFQRRVS